MASKAVEQFMKVRRKSALLIHESLRTYLITLSVLFSIDCHQIVGMPYLYSVLKPTIDRIFEEHKVCELDPCRVEKTKPLGIR